MEYFSYISFIKRKKSMPESFVKPVLLVLFILASSQLLFAKNNADSTQIKRTITDVNYAKAELSRHFEELHFAEDFAMPDPIIVRDVMLADSIEEKRNHAHSLQEKVVAGQRFLESLDALQVIDLPVGVVKSGGAVDYSILIDRIIFTSKAATMEVYMSLEIPQTGDRIAFNGKVPLSAKGGIAGTAKIYLLGDHPIKISNSTLLTIKGTSNTYVQFDCNGFQGMSIEAEVEFSRDFIVPEDAAGNEVPTPARVKTSFTTYIQSWSDLMVGITMPPFRVNGLKDFGFSVQQAFLDWSDLANPPGISFPKDYLSPFSEAGQPNLWQGFYLKRLEVRLPKSFTDKRASGSRVRLGVEHMILDHQGFTGAIFGENVIEDGDMSGWSYSLDRVSVALVINQVKGFELMGKLSIPVVKNTDGKPTRFGYRAQRGADGNYIFAVSIQDQVKMPLFVADVKLFAGSSVTVKEKDDKFYPSASLNGELTIRAAKASMNSIRFENMVINSEAPHFSLGTMGFGREGEKSNLSKYPVVINHIMAKSEGERVGIAFDLTVNIGGKADEEGFGGTGSLIVWGKHENAAVSEGQLSTQHGDWNFDKVEVTGIGVNIKKPGVVDLAGMITFFDDDVTYGDGFKGTLAGTIQTITVSATALFGTTPTYRYWFADALVKFAEGIPMIPGVVSATGFGGGFYSKMKQSTQPIASRLGIAPSGITYVPDENTLGIKAIVLVGAPRPEAWNGDVSLEVMMNRYGGINSVTLNGNANFMSYTALAPDKIKELATSSAEGKLNEKLATLIRGQVYGSMRLQFDNVNDVFHGNIEVFVNVAGGIVRGVSPGNKAGWAVLHFERNDWYVLIGTPDQPIGLEVARIFRTRSYFMLGKHLPGSPPPPSQVTEILGNVNLDYMRDMNALESGTGFAFGMNFTVDTGNLNFLMFYGRFAAGTGIDFMLKDYGQNYHCSGTSGPLGINGWYANGQAYAFVMGKVGIKVNLKFYKGNYDILSIGAAAIMQAKGPNPFWMKGNVGGYYNILGGLVKGTCKFEVTVGEDCRPVGEQNLLADVNIIAGVTPTEGTSDVDVFNTPQVAFNIPIDKEFEITDLENRVHRFRARLEEFSITENGTTLPGTLQWNEEHDVVIFTGHDILPGEKQLSMKAYLVFEEQNNGAWTRVMLEGKPVEEVSNTKFKTGAAPDYIPSQNVAISYPIEGQANFLPGEYADGFIQLKRGQPYLFTLGSEWTQKVRMTDPSTTRYVESNLTYNSGQARVNFTMPQGFEGRKIYHFEVLNIPAQKAVIDANVTKVTTQIQQDEAAGTASLTTKNVQGQIDRKDIKSIYLSSLRTSKYNTFQEKINSITMRAAVRADVDVNLFQLGAFLIGDELLDEAEMNGLMGAEKLIRMEAILQGNTWHENYVYPLVYDGYPLLGWARITRRIPTDLGLPPAKDIYFLNKDNTRIGNLMVRDGNLTAEPGTAFYEQNIRYNVMIPMVSDYRDTQQQIANYLSYNPGAATQRLSNLILKPFPVIRRGDYKFNIQYVIPGVNRVAPDYEWKLYNSIPDND
jgi:hypothetical protein